jgi:hypothetical protein
VQSWRVGLRARAERPADQLRTTVNSGFSTIFLSNLRGRCGPAAIARADLEISIILELLRESSWGTGAQLAPGEI